MAASTALYGVGIHEAIKSGDLKAMKKIQKEAEAYLESHGDVAAALEVLKAEIAKSGKGTGPVPLYGVIIHEAVASGDVDRMQDVLKQAQSQLSDMGDVRAALTALKAELGE